MAMTFLAFLFGLCLGALFVLVLILYVGWSGKSQPSSDGSDVSAFMQDAMEEMADISDAYVDEFLDSLRVQGDKGRE